MGRINWKRVILGGIVAAIVAGVGDGLHFALSPVILSEAKDLL